MATARPPHAALPASIAVILATLIAAPSSGSAFLVVAVGATLSALILLLWPAREVPFLLLPAVYQWSQVAAMPIQTIFTGETLAQSSAFGGPQDAAALFGLAAVLALAAGMRIGIKTRSLRALAPESIVRDWPQREILLLCLGAIALGHLLMAASNYAGPARQILRALGGINLAGLFLLAFWCLIRRRGMVYLALAAAFELVAGMTGFFADFRGPVLVLALATIAAKPHFRVGGAVLATVVAAAAVLLACFWSSVKVDYRAFLNGGTGEQTVVQPLDARLGYLLGAAHDFDRAQLSDGFDRLIARQGYIDFLALTIERVPRVMPHENGARLGETIKHVLTPRIIFPDKPVTPNDTTVTARYTGLAIDNEGNSNTSISIGYL
jgi:hypothetical protein